MTDVIGPTETPAQGKWIASKPVCIIAEGDADVWQRLQQDIVSGISRISRMALEERANGITTTSFVNLYFPQFSTVACMMLPSGLSAYQAQRGIARLGTHSYPVHSSDSCINHTYYTVYTTTFIITTRCIINGSNGDSPFTILLI